MALENASQQRQQQQQQSDPQVVVQVQKHQQLKVQAAGVSVSVFQSFPSKLLYVLSCIKSTTLGPEIVDAAVPWARIVIPAAEHFERMSKYVWRFLQVSVPAVGVLHFLAAVGTVDPAAHIWTAIVAGVPAAAYGIPLVLLFGICIYGPLLWIIIPVALVKKVDDAGTARNDFLHVSFGQQTTVVGVANFNLEQHVFAEQLRAEEDVVVMIYEDAWVADNFSTGRFFNEVGVCAFLVWELVILGTLGGIYPQASMTALWIIMRLGLCLVLPRVLLKVACIGGAVLWMVFNIAFCCVPAVLVGMGQTHVHEAVLNRACSRTRSSSSQDDVHHEVVPNLGPETIGKANAKDEIEKLEASVSAEGGVHSTEFVADAQAPQAPPQATPPSPPGTCLAIQSP